MGQDNLERELARKTLAAVRARLELVAAKDPAEVASPLTVRETLAFVRMLYRQARVQTQFATELKRTLR